MVMFSMAMIERVGSYGKGNAYHQVFKTRVLNNIHPK